MDTGDAEDAEGAPPLFAFEGVGVRRGDHDLLREVDATVPPAGVTVVIGPSGAGKTTLLRLCNRLEVPTTGIVRFRGEDVAGLDPLGLRRRAGMVFQRPALFGGTVRDNLAVAAPDAGDAAYVAALEAAALDPGLLDREARRLSGGEAQRACLARTLVTDPEVLLLDEPTSALDAGPRLAFEQLAVHLAGSGLPIVWVTHDLAQLERVATRVVGLVDGRAVYAGDPAGVRDHAALAPLWSTGG